MVKRAMEIYSKSIDKVKSDEQQDMFSIYIKRTAELHGITACRPVYEDAINRLNADGSREMCLRYAELEKKIGEIDRARAIYSHCANLCNPDIQKVKTTETLNFYVNLFSEILGVLERFRNRAW